MKAPIQEPEGFAAKLPRREYLHECFAYDAETGILSWRTRPSHHFINERTCNRWNGRYAGSQVSLQNTNGHLRTSMRKKFYYVHRIVWKMMTGEEPLIIDHINGDPADNRLENLRSVSQGLNARNQTPAARRKHAIGVYRQSAGYGWVAQVPINGRVKSKSFKTEADAAAWRVEQCRLQGFTDRHLGVSANG